MSDPSIVARRGTELTPREREVLLEVWRRGSVAGAARALGLSRHTVNGHLKNARSRLGVRTTIQAIRRVLPT